MKAVLRISGKSGNRLRDNKINLPGLAVRNHAIKAVALFCIGPADSLICINVDQLIIGSIHNVFGVIINLIFKGIELFFLVC